MIDTRRFVQVGAKEPEISISPYEIAGSHSMDYEATHRFLFKQGVYMPTPKIFTSFLTNVLEANDGERHLYYAEGTRVSDSDVSDMARHLTSAHLGVPGWGVGASNWLNARITEQDELEKVVGIDNFGNLIKVTTKLEPVLEAIGVPINFNFNSQGFPKPAIINNHYLASCNRNVYFCGAEKGVAGYTAFSKRAVFGCGSSPEIVDARVGSFGCTGQGEFETEADYKLRMRLPQ